MSNSYNLLGEDFIPCAMTDGTSKNYNLISIFENAHNIASIGSPTPFTRVSVLKLLTAILYRALMPYDEDIWFEIWENKFDTEKIKHYLNKHYQRFDILHKETPFYQIAEAIYDKAEILNNEKLYMDASIMKGLPLYSNYNFDGMKNTDLSNAALRILDIQNYSTGSKAKILKGDTRTKKRGYREPGWGARGTNVILHGKNLAQTLKLNLVPYKYLNPLLSPEQDMPVWERSQNTAAPEECFGEDDESRLPVGPADLFTYQPSRIKLNYDGTSVVSTVVGIGDRCTRRNKHLVDPWLIWKLSVDKKTSEDTWNPYKKFYPEDTAWQTLDSILPSTGLKNAKTASNLSFFREVSYDIEKDINKDIKIELFTVYYGTQDAIIEQVDSSMATLPAAILDKSNEEILNMTVEQLSLAKEATYIYTNYLKELNFIATRKKNVERPQSKYELLSKLQSAFNHWLSRALEQPYQTDKAIVIWKNITFQIVANQMDEELSRYAHLRISERTENGVLLNPFTVNNKFKSILYKKIKG